MTQKSNDKYMGSVKVGSKGQIVIPKEVRDMFGIMPGDSLVLLADKNRGIALNNFDFYNNLVEDVFNNKKSMDEDTNKFFDKITKLKDTQIGVEDEK